LKATWSLLVAAVLGAGAGGLLYRTQVAEAAPAPKSPVMAARPETALDLTKIDRTIRKEPAYRGEPRYGLLVWGPKARTRIWLVIDGKTLYVDRNGNGDLTEKGEQFSPMKVNDDQSQYLEFHVGEIVEADRQTKHSGHRCLLSCEIRNRIRRNHTSLFPKGPSSCDPSRLP
jgi:hypothetical protein